jgi:hypothetical protein
LDEDARVATGDREREDVHFEPDPDQLVKTSHLVRAAGPLPPEEQSAASERDALPAGAAVQDVRVAADEASAWDARPPPADAAKSGNPTGH